MMRCIRSAIVLRYECLNRIICPNFSPRKLAILQGSPVTKLWMGCTNKSWGGYIYIDTSVRLVQFISKNLIDINGQKNRMSILLQISPSWVELGRGS